MQQRLMKIRADPCNLKRVRVVGYSLKTRKMLESTKKIYNDK